MDLNNMIPKENLDAFLDDMYKLEESEALEALNKIMPTLEEWIELSKHSGAPPYMKDDEGGPCPF